MSGRTLIDGETRQLAAELARLKFGELSRPLPVNPVTDKRLYGTGRYPISGTRSPIVGPEDATPAAEFGRYRSRRERAAELQERMAGFSAVYNAAWRLRDSFFGPDARRKESAIALWAVLLDELRRTNDHEALLFALVDSIACSSHGLPWEP